MEKNCVYIRTHGLFRSFRTSLNLPWQYLTACGTWKISSMYGSGAAAEMTMKTAAEATVYAVISSVDAAEDATKAARESGVEAAALAAAVLRRAAVAALLEWLGGIVRPEDTHTQETATGLAGSMARLSRSLHLSDFD